MDPAPAGKRELALPMATPAQEDATSPDAALAGLAAGFADSLGCRTTASCRAVGWSKTIVLGSALEPDAVCSWLRSSTAPSESIPASISGTSASISPPPVLRTSSRTVSRETPPCASAPSLAVTAPNDAAFEVVGSNAASRAGAGPPRPRNLPQVITAIVNAAGAPCCVASARAPRP
eukprot:2274857-Prymnesium_polylepis.1